MSQRGTGNIRVKVFESVKKELVIEAIRKNVELGSILHTDASDIYNPLHDEYFRESVIHSRGEWVKDSVIVGRVHVNNVENFWGIMNRGVYGIYHQISFKHLQR